MAAISMFSHRRRLDNLQFAERAAFLTADRRDRLLLTPLRSCRHVFTLSVRCLILADTPF